MKRTTSKHKYIHLAGHPVRVVVNGLMANHSEKAKKSGEIVIGSIVMVVAAGLNTLPVTLIPQALWNALTWLLHGLGSAPVVEAVLKQVDKAEGE